MFGQRILGRLVLAIALGAGAAQALAQHRPQGPGGGHMSREEREKLREDMHSTRRDVYRDGQRHPQQLPPAGGRMSQEERDKLRRDVEDANRGMRRR